MGFNVGETKVEEEGKCEYGKVGFWDKIKLVGGGEVGVLNKNVGEMEVEEEGKCGAHMMVDFWGKIGLDEDGEVGFSGKLTVGGEFFR